MGYYEVSIEYEVPEFSEIRLEAKDEHTARQHALNEFIKNNPEAIDPVVVKAEQLR